MSSHGLHEVKPTPEQTYNLEVMRVAFLTACPFYHSLFYSIGREVLTDDPRIPVAATDGRHIVLNLARFTKYKTAEQVTIMAHEMDHLLCRHPQRFEHYLKLGAIKGMPAHRDFANVCMDLVVNANIVDTLVKDGSAAFMTDWIYDPKIPGTDLWEDVYERLCKNAPKQPQGRAGQGASQPGPGDPTDPPGQPSPPNPGKTYGASGSAPKGAKSDPVAQANGGAFDVLLPVPIGADGAPDLPDESEFKEAVARAAAVAKAMGKLPAHIQRIVADILEPQVDWREHIRLLITGRVGARGETWARPNRRRLALNPIVVMPGRRGYGAETVVVGVDTSGSIGDRELAAFLAEVGGILNDAKPHRIVVIGCDAEVTQVDELTSLDELGELRARGIKGGGGTRFEPVFDFIEEHRLKPEAVIYLTDGMGSYPDEKPAWPTVWAMTTDIEPPWGDHVRIKVG